ncbi:MAG TPA: ATP-binding cassette domain-containing protein [Spirochaetia bacterium]|nr:ATP-binding cassette domain-containing protein [Spirochaetia bacterium]
MADACISVDRLQVDREGVPVLRDVSLSVACGERLIVAGPNGAGKTTLLKAILGMVRISSGRVTVLGHDVGTRDWARRRRRVGYVNQESVQVDFPISGREVVEIGVCATPLPREEKRRRIDDAMEAVGCSALSRRMYARLSGGEKQKLSLARCLCQDPELLLLDEPTSSLDPRARAELMELLDTLNEKRRITMVMVSHDAQVLSEPAWTIRHMEAGAFA